MARKRFQRGQLLLRGTRNPVWVGRWREDVIENGCVRRIQRKEILGTKTDYPTRKLALRALEDRLADINHVSYQPKPVAKFAEFAEKWQRFVLPNLKPSSQPPIKSQLRKRLLPALGSVAMKDITGERVQSFLVDCDLNPKTIKNLIGTLRIMWNSAKAWGYVGHGPIQWACAARMGRACPTLLLTGGHQNASLTRQSHPTTRSSGSLLRPASDAERCALWTSRTSTSTAV